MKIPELPVLKKTPVAGRFTDQLIRATDQICFASLQQWEFAQRLKPLVAAGPKKFTTELFPGNPFSKAIFRKAEELPDFSKDAEVIALQMGIIAAAEYMLAYLEDVQLFRKGLVGDAGEVITNEAEEEQLRLKLLGWRGSAPDQGYFWTMGYFRLLRNHYAHVNEVPHSSLQSYVRSFGTPLNKFWKNGITETRGIDFQTLAATTLTPTLAFGIVNLLRVSVLHVDHMVSDTITLFDAVRWTLDEVRKSLKGRAIKIERLSSKVRLRLFMEWKIDEPLATIIPLVQRALAEQQ